MSKKIIKDSIEAGIGGAFVGMGISALKEADETAGKIGGIALSGGFASAISKKFMR